MFILPAAFGAFYRQGKGLGFMMFIVHEFADVCSAVARLLRCVVLAVVERKTERCLVAGRVGVYFEPFRRTYNFPGFPFLFRTWGGVIFTVQILYLFLMHTWFSQPEVVRKFSARDKLFVDARTLLIIMLRWSLPHSQIGAVCELLYTPILGSGKFVIKNVKPEAVPECKSFLREERGLTAQY